MWWLDPNAASLRYISFWSAPSSRVEEFEMASRARTFACGEGLPGRVWDQARPYWIPEIAKDNNFPRAPVAIKEGLNAAFAFPIVGGEKFVGVMEFFSSEIRQPDDALLAMFGSIGSQIGQFIERRRAEEALRVREAELEVITDTTPLMLTRCSRELRYVYVNRAYANMLGLQPQDIIGKAIVEVIGTDGYESIRPQSRRCCKGNPLNTHRKCCSNR